MENKRNDASNYVLEEELSSGSVKISNDVVAMIAHIAACEVEGISGMAGNAGADFLSRVGYRELLRGVKVSIENRQVKVYMAVVVDYGSSIPAVSHAVQDKVKQTIESMTGLRVTDVNIRVSGVNVDKGK